MSSAKGEAAMSSTQEALQGQANAGIQAAQQILALAGAAADARHLIGADRDRGVVLFLATAAGQIISAVDAAPPEPYHLGHEVIEQMRAQARLARTQPRIVTARGTL